MYKILIVDDEEIIRRGLTKIVEMASEDFEVAGEAANGKTGLDMALKLNPDIVIVDIRMPFMNGLEMIDRIKQTQDDMQFIILSAHTDFTFTRHAIKSGVIDYLMKPVNRLEFIELLNNIKKVLDSKKCSAAMDNNLKINESSTEEQKNESRIIEIAKEYINSNFFNDISLENAANHVCMNPNYFSTIFKKETGENFIDYLTRIRIERSKVLLANPMLKVYEIAQIVGNYSPKHFTKLFRKVCGLTPTEYRETLK